VSADGSDAQENLHELGRLLPDIFQAFAEKRQPRTEALVKGARTQGQMRVVTGGPEACRERDRKITAAWKDLKAVAAKYDGLCKEPF
jgi:salicylate hydroxylase